MARLKFTCRRANMDQIVKHVTEEVFGESADRHDHDLVSAILRHRLRGVTGSL